jgi:DNA-binding transcriptional MerR regulator
MRVVILRKQEMGELPTENEEEMRRQLVEQVRQLLRELETNVEGMSIDEIKALLQQLGAGQRSLRKGEVAIITESDLEDLEGLVQAVEELKENFPPLDRNEAKRLLKVVRKAMEKLTAIERSLEEGIVELRKQMEEFYDTEELGDTEEKLYSPDDIIEREKEKIRPIEGLVFSLKEEMASLRRALNDIEKNADLLAIPGERDVFIEEGWFHEKVRAIRSHILEIAEMGMELVRRLAELGGVEIKEPWKR